MKYRIAIGCFLFFQAIWAQNPISIDSITTYAGRNYYTHPDSAQYYLHKGIALAEAQGDFYKKGIFLNKLITQKTRIRDYDSARYYFKYTKTYLEQNQLETLFPDVHSEIAETYFYMERLDSALYHFKISDTLYHRLGDSIGVLIAKNNMANVYQIQGNYKEAIVNMLEAAKNVDTTQYLYIKVEMYHNIAQLYRQVHEPAKASQFATRSLELALQNPNYPQDLVTSYGIMAQLATDRSDFGQAAHYIDLAKQTIQVRGLDIVNYKVLGSEASLLVAQGAFEKAIPFIQDALTVGAEQGLSDFEIFSLKKDLALCFFKLNRLQEAQNLLLELLDSAQKNGRVEDMAILYQQLSEVHELQGNTVAALSDFKKYNQYKDSVLGLQKQESINDAIVRYETVLKEKALFEARANLAEKELEVERKNLLLYGSLGLLLVLGLIGYLIYNQQRLKNRQLKREGELKTALARIETQNRLQEQRLRISRDLHDNIGAQLTFVTSSVDNLQYGLEGRNPEISKKLSSLSAFTTQTIYELRDTIWAMNKEQISVEDLQARISNFMEKAGSVRDEVAFGFEVSEGLSKELLLPSVQGMNLYRIIQEAVNNALKYAEASQIKVKLFVENNHCVATITDDGKGFDLAAIEQGNGLNNMKKRARDLGGDATITSEKEKGTQVTVRFPWHESVL
ncbi:MAG: sensor histidine kinase [Flavobacteriaceae bacterium]